MTSLAAVAAGVLATGDAAATAHAARALAAAWRAGTLTLAGTAPLPDSPARPARPAMLPASRMPRRGRAGSPRARFAMLHALAHIELNAIDLAADMLGRFAPPMPPAFADDWVLVLDEEAQHFNLLHRWLQTSGGDYGDLPAHDGLWQAAHDTRHDLAARLAIVPQVLEARGLDVTPAMIARFAAVGDERVVSILTRILADEIGHVAIGNRWFRFVCDRAKTPPQAAFHALVQRHFRGMVKPPFNDSARLQAGLTPGWYLPLGSPAA
ncbi:ferritin-like domain-containing protein [Sandaracinobacteroides saxicola]|uniref:Ferritin-like domain-containing protein n=1 Tax=Sandaracinobacteroides saxicola TaxID=2759707 RepID=A0A7G5IKK4_9SPHN|nr:ferritin-like domain-containing protein [Sandaracinobacteroides saxicola]QMW23896.1 ferritin-like domain-containing protein [Sandaracinobacteroides saxicola]